MWDQTFSKHFLYASHLSHKSALEYHPRLSTNTKYCNMYWLSLVVCYVVVNVSLLYIVVDESKQIYVNLLPILIGSLQLLGNAYLDLLFVYTTATTRSSISYLSCWFYLDVYVAFVRLSLIILHSVYGGLSYCNENMNCLNFSFIPLNVLLNCLSLNRDSVVFDSNLYNNHLQGWTCTYSQKKMTTNF